MVARLDYLTVLKHDDQRGDRRARKSVRDEDRRLVLPQPVKLVKYLLLRHRIERRRRLVKDQNIRIAVKRPCYRELLPLTARKLESLRLKYPHKRRVVALRQLLYILVGTALACGFLYLLRIKGLLNISEMYILRYREGILPEILEYYSEHRVEIFNIVFTKVLPVKKDNTLGRVIEPCQELYQRSLTGTVQPYKHDRFARSEGEVYILKHITLGSRIAEADVLKLYRM